VNLVPGILRGYFGDTHIYAEHEEYLITQLHRDPYDLPELDLPPIATVFDTKVEEIQVKDYKCHGPLNMRMVV
jgi:thymidylate synthase